MHENLVQSGTTDRGNVVDLAERRMRRTDRRLNTLHRNGKAGQTSPVAARRPTVENTPEPDMVGG